MKESNILNACMIALSKAGATVFRNNTGVLLDRNGRPVKFGLCVGSADIIGIAPDGLFLAVECKTATGMPTDKQITFLTNVRNAGGRAGVARAAEEAVAIACDTLSQVNARNIV